ncbi:MAG: hypothetical protein KGQ60_06570, partial [Planctomycetes bacterium]|nr:hypothetical protein [Planctomycetota bacterium]
RGYSGIYESDNLYLWSLRMSPVPPGGPSTVNGVLYQMLFSLLTLGGYRVDRHRLGDGRLEQVTLILEPSSGGDQQALYPGVRVVTQLKARSTGGSWSLQEIVRGVHGDCPGRPECLLAQPDSSEGWWHPASFYATASTGITHDSRMEVHR